MPFSHLDKSGNVSMVDVSEREKTLREALACARLKFPPAIFAEISEKGVPKGDMLAAARVAGIQGAKKTSDLIPLTHPIGIDYVKIDIKLLPEENSMEITCRAKASQTTGVEMEALTGASVAALTVYDMAKSLDKGIEITEIKLLEKTGGRSGEWRAGNE
ncbi:MAG: cyclic pyranopterin monophosphate synthase MoaC [bacterium]